MTIKPTGTNVVGVKTIVAFTAHLKILLIRFWQVYVNEPGKWLRLIANIHPQQLLVLAYTDGTFFQLFEKLSKR